MKKKIFCGIVVLLLILICSVAAFYVYIRPYLKLKNTISELENKTYTYTVDGKLSGFDYPVLGNSFEGQITGEKGADVLHGEIVYNGHKYLGLYVDSKKNMVFDVSAFFQDILNDAGEKTDLALAATTYLKKNIYVSLDQFKALTGQDIKTIKDAGIDAEVFDSLSKGNEKKKGYAVKRLKTIEKNQMLLGEDAWYFQITLDERNTDLIIGVPKNDDKKISLNVTDGSMEWKLTGEYNLEKVDELEMPETSFSDETFSFLGAIYSKWMKQKQ